MSPSTKYDIYCYTDDLASHVMILSDALETLTLIETLCCRQIQSVISYPSIIQYYQSLNLPEKIFIFQLNARPTDLLRVEFKLNLVKCASSSSKLGSTDAKVLPPTIIFDSTSLDLTASIIVRGTVTGCYILIATGSSDGFDIYDPAVVYFQLLNFRSSPNAPILTNVLFSDKGNSLLFIFDSSTDRGFNKIKNYETLFDCSLIVLFPGSESSECKWNNIKTLEADFRSSILKPNVADIASLIGGVLKAACVEGTNCGSYPTNIAYSTKIATAQNPALPIPILISSPIVAACDNIHLDPTASQGFLGRVWNKVEWKVVSTGHARNAIGIQSYLNFTFTDTSRIVVIPNHYFAINTHLDAGYEITLTVTNFLLQTSSTKAIVIIDRGLSSIIIPQIFIMGANAYTFRSKPITLYASASFPPPPCFDNSTVYNLLYSWKVYLGTNYIASIKSKSIDQRYFKLDPYDLQAGSIYTIVVEVSSLSSPASYMTIQATASGKLFIGISDVLAVISGGSKQTVSLTDDIILDASKSVDYNDPNAVLKYAWNCVVIYPEYGDPCLNLFSLQEAYFTISKGLLPPKSYNITVVVSNLLGKSSSVSLSLIVLAASIPVVTVNNLSPKYNPDSKVILTGQIECTIPYGTAAWTSSNINLALNGDMILTPLKITLVEGTNLFQLAIAANSLTPGMNYQFQLSATYPKNNGFIALTVVNVLINQPPHGGSLVVKPSQGYALTTSFYLLSSAWEDDPSDYPLSYRLAYYIADSQKLTTIKDLDPVLYGNAIFSQGIESLGYQVSCVVIAIDLYGSAGYGYASVIVLPIDNTAVMSRTTDFIQSALSDKNPASLNQAINAAIPSINTVSCNVPIPCNTINRNVCQMTAGTCGSCLDGFIGVASDSNVPCNKTSNLISIGNTCNSDLQCISGRCTSTSVSGICMDVAKSCPNKCSGKGTCIFTDYFGNKLQFCSILDSTCIATCECSRSRRGLSCSYTAYDYSLVTSFRENLCFNLKHLDVLQDVTSDVIRTRALTIGNLFYDSNQISNAALNNCSSILLNIVMNNLELSCPTNTFNVIMETLSNILKVGSNLPPNVLVNITNTITLLSTYCQSNSLAVGEKPLTMILNNMRMMMVIGDKTSIKDSYMSPQSDFEVFNNMPTSSVGIQASALNSSGASAIGVTTVVYSNNPHGSRTNATQFGLQITPYASNADLVPNKRKLNSITTTPAFSLILQNDKPIKYTILEPSTQLFHCFRPYQAIAYELNGTCSSGLTFNVLCPPHSKGIYKVNCPSFVTYPYCTAWNGFEFEASSECVVTNYTSSSTTCYCDITKRRGRRQLSNENSNLQEFSTKYRIDWIQYTEEFQAAPSATEVKRNYVILSSLLFIVGLFILGLFAFLHWDLKDLDLNNSLKNKKYSDDDDNFNQVRTINIFFDSIFPDELRDGPWLTRFWIRLRSEHPWLTLWTPTPTTTNHSRNIYDSRTLKWTLVMGRFLIFLFMNSVLASYLYADNGDCEAIIHKDKCISTKTPGDYSNSCKWRDDNETCEFNPPHISFVSILILTLVVTLLCIPLYLIWRYFVINIASFIKYQKRLKKVEITTTTNRNKNILLKYDEFVDIQTKKGTLLRAARLEKIKKTIDFVLPIDELNSIRYQIEDDAEKWRNQKLFGDVIGFVPLTRVRYYLEVSSLSNTIIERNIIQTRKYSNRIRQELEYIQNKEEQEALLIKYFVINVFTGYKREIVKKYFMGKHYIYGGVRTYMRLFEQYLSLVLFPIFAILMLIFIYIQSIHLGTRCTNIWLLVSLLTLLQDIFLLYPFIIWLLWIFIYNDVSIEVRQFYEQFAINSRIILRRTSSLMRESNALVQHLNPACRAARMFPALPISRLLLSISDKDMPVLSYERNYFHILYENLMNILLFYIFLPDLFQQSMLSIISAAILDFTILLFRIIANYSQVLLILMVLVLLLIILLCSIDIIGWIKYICKSNIENEEYMKQRHFEIKHKFYSIEDDDISNYDYNNKNDYNNNKVSEFQDVNEQLLQFSHPTKSVFEKSETIKFKDGTIKVISRRFNKVQKLRSILEKNDQLNIEKPVDLEFIQEIKDELIEPQKRLDEQKSCYEDDNVVSLFSNNKDDSPSIDNIISNSTEGNHKPLFTIRNNRLHHHHYHHSKVLPYRSHLPVLQELSVVDYQSASEPQLQLQHEQLQLDGGGGDDDNDDMSSISSRSSIATFKSALHLPIKIKPGSQIHSPQQQDIIDSATSVRSVRSSYIGVQSISGPPISCDQSVYSEQSNSSRSIHSKLRTNERGPRQYTNEIVSVRSQNSILGGKSVASDVSDEFSGIIKNNKVLDQSKDNSYLRSKAFLFEDDDNNSINSGTKSLMDFNYDSVLWSVYNKELIMSEDNSANNAPITMNTIGRSMKSSALVPVTDDFGVQSWSTPAISLSMKNNNNSNLSVDSSSSNNSEPSSIRYTKTKHSKLYSDEGRITTTTSLPKPIVTTTVTNQLHSPMIDRFDRLKPSFVHIVDSDSPMKNDRLFIDRNQTFQPTKSINLDSLNNNHINSSEETSPAVFYDGKQIIHSQSTNVLENDEHSVMSDVSEFSATFIDNHNSTHRVVISTNPSLIHKNSQNSTINSPPKVKETVTMNTKPIYRKFNARIQRRRKYMEQRDDGPGLSAAKLLELKELVQKPIPAILLYHSENKTFDKTKYQNNKIIELKSNYDTIYDNNNNGSTYNSSNSSRYNGPGMILAIDTEESSQKQIHPFPMFK